ncbi:L-aspartate oxidase [Kiloniella sp. b19]|uniref:L-aspartate oxidase n=1 Tax=Kiloniella sp. GXU_MW_B19 TaxID=3141326 RepID=UPI0031E3753F
MNRTPPPPAEVLILGAGLAAVSTALHLAEQKPEARIIMVTSGRFAVDASSAWAQGGIASALGADDTPGDHARDTIAVGGGLCNEAIVKLVTDAGPDAIEWLEKQGVVFDREDGTYSLSREAAHQHNRVAHSGRDSTGASVMAALKTAVGNCPSIELREETEVISLLKSETGRICGALLRQENQDRPYSQSAQATVLATGGVGQLFSRSTNPAAIRGSSLALAARAGAQLTDLEFVQFHPTSIDGGPRFKQGVPQPLATEALRGQGAVLLNNRGERFMAQHPQQELAPRDEVARAIFREWSEGREPKLDCTTAIGPRFAKDFPTVFRLCQEIGIDPSREAIPVVPAVHYHMGGIRVNARGRSSLEGLWACGEAACTGLHGANRLASNSLLEALVFGRQVATDLVDSPPTDSGLETDDTENSAVAPLTTEQTELIGRIQRESFKALGVVRNATALNSYLTFLDQTALSPPAKHHRISELLISGRLIALCALARQESRGAHFREDARGTDARYQKPLTITFGCMPSFSETPKCTDHN